jgi:hypothetical protein
MNRHVRSLETAFSDPAQHIGCGAAGHQALLRQLKEPDAQTRTWMLDWIQTTFGNDGLPREWWAADGSLDEDEVPANLLKLVRSHIILWQRTIALCTSA